MTPQVRQRARTARPKLRVRLCILDCLPSRRRSTRRRVRATRSFFTFGRFRAARRPAKAARFSGRMAPRPRRLNSRRISTPNLIPLPPPQLELKAEPPPPIDVEPMPFEVAEAEPPSVTRLDTWRAKRDEPPPGVA